MPDSELPWYRDGLAFECTRCGACCTGAPGYVWVELDEMTQLAEFKNLPIDQFSSRFVRRVGNRHSLVERSNGDCIFWDAQAGCTVYSARPTQCRTWPFWPENIENAAAWESTSTRCPGAGSGRVYSIEEITLAAERTPK